MELFDDYLLTGGLPEVIVSLINEKSDLRVKTIQQKILDCYKKELLNINNYIGKSTNLEIEYAKTLGKEIYVPNKIVNFVVK